MDLDMKEYLNAFLDESSEQLELLGDLLLSLESNPEQPEVVNEIFRVAHTLKGMAGAMGFDGMASLTHAMEDLLDLMRKGELAITGDDVSLLFRCLDTLQVMIDQIRKGGRDGDVNADELLKALKAKVEVVNHHEATKSQTPIGLTSQEAEWVKKAQDQGMKVYHLTVHLDPQCLLKSARAYLVVSRLEGMGEIIKTVPPVEELEKEGFDYTFEVYLATKEEQETTRHTVMSISEIANVEIKELTSENEHVAEELQKTDETRKVEEVAEEASSPEPSFQGMRKMTGTIRVDINRLDKLMNLVGELVIGRARIERLAQEAGLKAFEEPLAHLGRISGEIQELVTKLRMVPISYVFDRFPRLVRDLCKSLGKEARLVIEGKETELDRTVVDEIGESLVHLIRNALDHGIETPEEREAKGKKREGTVRIAAYQEGNSVIVEVADDGCGIDANVVRRKAVEKGLYSAEEAQALSDEDAIKLVFLPGFSTADKVSDLSGRGVGMDVVKSKVESLGGQFAVHSKLDRGTRVIIRLPLTLAIVLALLVSVGDEAYAIPLEDVEETLLVNKNDIRSVHGTPVVTVRGEILSLQSLAGLLRAHSRLEADEFPVVVVRAEGKRRGLIVDELIGQQEIVIKPLGKLLSKVHGIAGATILGDGNVALILDVASLGSRPERAVTYEARVGAPQ